MKSTAIAASLIGLSIAMLAGCATNTTNEPAAEASASAKSEPASSTSAASPDRPVSTATESEETDRVVRFAFNSSALDEENTRIVEEHARYLLANPNAKIRIEGHADERGTREYNLALGERRAKAVAKVLRVLGVGADRIETRSYGEEKPVAMAHNESAWAQNRRGEFVYR
jgi:peptidoglycan-associated lipoprotein